MKVGSYVNDSVCIDSGVLQFKANIKYRNSKKSFFKFEFKLHIKNNIKFKLQTLIKLKNIVF